MVAAGARTAVTFSLSPGQAGDAPAGRELLKTLENKGWEGTHVIMDKAYEGDETRQLVLELAMLPFPDPQRVFHQSLNVTKCQKMPSMARSGNDRVYFCGSKKEKGKLANYTFGRYIRTWKTETRNEYFTNR